MNYLDLSLVTLFLLLAYLYLNPPKSKEGFENHSPVDQYSCYPGTYWRSKTYDSICQKSKEKHPERLTVEGEKFRTPDSRYQMVCTTNKHLQRNCRLVKVYDKYY